MTRSLPNSQPFENNEPFKEFMFFNSSSSNSWSFPHVFLDFLDRLDVQSIVTWINTNEAYLIYNTCHCTRETERSTSLCFRTLMWLKSPFAKCCLWVTHIILLGVIPKWTSTTHGLHAFTLKRQGGTIWSIHIESKSNYKNSSQTRISLFRWETRCDWQKS